jgi:S-adenosylmethionine hydrolase
VPRPIVTVTTDFGTGSPYVAAMEGVVLAAVPDATLVEVSSGVPAFDIAAGAFVLWAGTRHFPRGAVHLAVVDPGVGSERHAVAFEAGGSWYVGPDNGLFWLVATQTAGGVGAVVELARPAGGSATFEGRDVFAPAAGALAAGRPLTTLGEPLSGHRLLDPIGDGTVVLWVDAFGNLVTNLRQRPAAVRIGNVVVSETARTYAEAPPGRPFLYLGSMGFWEVGVRQGRADEVLGVAAGARAERLV